LEWLEDPALGDAWLIIPNRAGYPAELSTPPADTEAFETDRMPGLAVRLALAKPDRDGMAAFVGKHGLLFERRIADGRLAGSLGNWLAARDTAGWCLSAWFDDAPLPHAAELRTALAGLAPQPREPAISVINRELALHRTRLTYNTVLRTPWPDGPDLAAQIWGELMIHMAGGHAFSLCARCRNPFIPQRSTGMFCSDSCRSMTVRDRRTERTDLLPEERARRLLARIDQELQDAAHERLPGPALLSEHRAALTLLAAGDRTHAAELPRLERIITAELNLLDLRRDARDLVTPPAAPARPGRAARERRKTGHRVLSDSSG
jgi:hypothetical protein